MERIISATGGGLLAAYGLRKNGLSGWSMAVGGGLLLFRGVTGYCPANEAVGRDTAEKENSLEITRSLTINKPRQELYDYWRQVENLPTFMKHLKAIRSTGDQQSHWVARLPDDTGTVEWEARVTREEEHQRIAWQSLPDADVENEGEVIFTDAPAGRGTIVQATITYRLPAASVSGSAAKLLNPVFKQMVKEDLRRFKRLMETGEIPTVEGQPSGR